MVCHGSSVYQDCAKVNNKALKLKIGLLYSTIEILDFPSWAEVFAKVLIISRNLAVHGGNHPPTGLVPSPFYYL